MNIHYMYVQWVPRTDSMLLGLVWGQRLDRGCETLGFPERKNSSILLLFLMISKVYSMVLLAFKALTYQSFHIVSVGWLLIDQSHSSKPPLLLACFQMDVIQHECISSLMRLEGDRVHWRLGRPTFRKYVPLGYWAPYLQGKEKLQCEQMRPDLGEIVYESHTCSVKNKTPSSLW